MKYIFYLTILIFGLIFIGCGSAPGVKNTPNSAPSKAVEANVETPPPVNSAESEKAKDEVISSTKKLQDLKFWTARTEFESLPALNGEMQYMAPDRFYIKQGENEAIVIGADSYAKIDGKWQKSPQDMSGLKDAQKNALSEEDIKKIKNVEVIGKEKLGNKDTTVYFHRTAGNNSSETLTRIWIAADSRLVLKSEVESKIGGKSQKITTTYDYEKPVRIEAPKIEK